MIAQVVADFPTLADKAQSLSRWYVFAVLYAEKDEEGRVEQPKSERPTESTADRLRRACTARGIPAHRIEAEVRRLTPARRR